MDLVSMDLLSCWSGGISVDEKIRPFRSSTVVVEGSNDNVDTPCGYLSRTWISTGIYVQYYRIAHGNIRHLEQVNQGVWSDLHSLRHDFGNFGHSRSRPNWCSITTTAFLVYTSTSTISTAHTQFQCSSHTPSFLWRPCLFLCTRLTLLLLEGSAGRSRRNPSIQHAKFESSSFS